MEPWSFEADLVRLSHDRDLDSFKLVQNKAVEAFVGQIDRDSRFFVVAPKGVGKTLLLKYKSVRYRTEKADFVFIPPLELCEKLSSTPSDIALAADDLAVFTTRNHWQDIWTLCLSSVILKETGGRIPNALGAIFGDARSIDDFLKALLRDRKNLFRYTRFIATDLSPAIQQLRIPVAVFVDNVDEAMERHVGANLLKTRRTQKRPLGAISELVWINAQLGLMDAIKGLHGKNSHIRVFASIRLEAFTADVTPTHAQTGIYCAFLGYNDDDLRKIFDNNVDAMNAVDLVSPDAANHVEKLLGFSRIIHPSVIDTAGNPQSEDVFAFILRHTLRRPRDLVEMGNYISRLKPDERTPDSIRALVNNQSSKILVQYENETVPYWNYAESNVLLGAVKQNILSSRQIRRLSALISKKVQRLTENEAIEPYHEHPFCSFYRRGLLGYLQPHPSSNQYVQKFLPAAEYIFDDKATLPQSEYYLLHPCLVAELRKSHGATINFDRYNIVGYDYPFTYPPGARKTELHIHIGAGRLGLGLVVPLLASARNICVIQRPLGKWAYLSERTDDQTQEIELRVNNITLRLRVVHDRVDETLGRAAIQHWKDGGHLLVLAKNPSFLTALFHEATSVSTALKGGLPFAEDLLGLVKAQKLRNVYCFENEFKEVMEFKRRVQARDRRIKVLPVVADRICRNVRIEDGVVPRVHVDCELYQHVYVQILNSHVRRLFGQLQDVTLAHDEDELMYFYDTKFYLMNSIHAAMAFHTYAKLAQKNVPFEKWGEQVLVVDTNAPYVTTWIYIQICRIIHRNRKLISRRWPTKDEKTVFEELYAQAYQISKRIDRSGDEVQRIVGTDPRSLNEKFETRCMEMSEFVRAHWAEVESWSIPTLPSRVEILSELNEFSEHVIMVAMKALRAGTG
jgi:hypothetical protein